MRTKEVGGGGEDDIPPSQGVGGGEANHITARFFS